MVETTRLPLEYDPIVDGKGFKIEIDFYSSPQSVNYIKVGGCYLQFSLKCVMRSCY